MKFVSHSLEETAEIAKKFAEEISRMKKSSALVAGLYGNLGAGKTSFTQAFGKILGVSENITSPTFVIMKKFPLQNFAFKNLIHVDAYRLERAGEIEKLGWADVVADPENLVIVEWPEKVKDAMPQDHIKIHFTFVDETTRQIEWE